MLMSSARRESWGRSRNAAGGLCLWCLLIAAFVLILPAGLLADEPAPPAETKALHEQRERLQKMWDQVIEKSKQCIVRGRYIRPGGQDVHSLTGDDLARLCDEFELSTEHPQLKAFADKVCVDAEDLREPFAKFELVVSGDRLREQIDNNDEIESDPEGESSWRSVVYLKCNDLEIHVRKSSEERWQVDLQSTGTLGLDVPLDQLLHFPTLFENKWPVERETEDSLTFLASGATWRTRMVVEKETGIPRLIQRYDSSGTLRSERRELGRLDPKVTCLPRCVYDAQFHDGKIFRLEFVWLESVQFPKKIADERLTEMVPADTTIVDHRGDKDRSVISGTKTIVLDIVRHAQAMSIPSPQPQR